MTTTKKFTLIILIGVVVLCFISGILFFLVWPLRVPTGSMANTIIPVDHIVATKWFFGELHRGDLVLFQHSKGEYRISRVVGLPGESVRVSAGRVYVNDRPLPEIRVTAKESDRSILLPLEILSIEGDGPYRVYYTREQSADLDLELPYAGAEPVRLDQNSYFLMGDNRDNSEDSRYHGPVKREQIWGRPRLVYGSKDPLTGEPRLDRAFTNLK